MKDPGCFAVAGLPRLDPRNRQWLELVIGQVIRLAAHQGLAPYKCGAFGREAGIFFVGAIDIRVPPDIRDASEDRMLRVLFVEKATRRVSVPSSMVIHEGSAKDVLAPSDLFAINFIREWTAKAVIGRAQRDQGFA